MIIQIKFSIALYLVQETNLFFDSPCSMKKIVIFGTICLWVVILSVYSFPWINCLVNKKTTCFYSFYERSQVEYKLSLNKNDFTLNKVIYEKLVDFIEKQGYLSIEQDTPNAIVYTLSWALWPNGFAKRYLIDKNVIIGNKSIYDIFSDLWLSSISNGDTGVRVSKYPLFLARWFLQYYLFDKQWWMFFGEPVVIQDGNKIIHQNNIDWYTEIIPLDNKWFLVTIRHTKKPD